MHPAHRAHKLARAHEQPPYHKRPPASRRKSKLLSPRPNSSRLHAKITIDNKSADRSKHVSHDDLEFMNDTTCVPGESDYDSSDIDDDGSTFHWEEEDTLFSELMNSGPQQSEQDDLDDMIDSLQDSFTAKGTMLKKDIADTLVGTHRHIKKIMSLAEENVDPYYGNGISLFKRGSTGIEATCYARAMEIKETYEATERKIESLFDEIKAEFDLRDKLWIKLDDSIKAIINPVLESVKDTPAKIEHIIAKLEKQLEQEFNSDKAKNPTHKLLQELLKRS